MSKVVAWHIGYPVGKWLRILRLKWESERGSRGYRKGPMGGVCIQKAPRELIPLSVAISEDLPHIGNCECLPFPTIDG